MELIYSDDAEDGVGCSATRIVPCSVSGSSRSTPRRLMEVIEKLICLC